MGVSLDDVLEMAPLEIAGWEKYLARYSGDYRTHFLFAQLTCVRCFAGIEEIPNSL